MTEGQTFCQTFFCMTHDRGTDLLSDFFWNFSLMTEGQTFCQTFFWDFSPALVVLPHEQKGTLAG